MRAMLRLYSPTELLHRRRSGYLHVTMVSTAQYAEGSVRSQVDTQLEAERGTRTHDASRAGTQRMKQTQEEEATATKARIACACESAGCDYPYRARLLQTPASRGLTQEAEG